MADGEGPDSASGRTSGFMSTRSPRVEVMSRIERRRQWSLEAKQRIVAESYESGGSVLAVARRHGINSGQLYTWRRQQRCAAAAPGFLPVEMIADAGAAHSADAVPSPAGQAETPPHPSPPPIAGMIEIVLPSGVRLRVDNSVEVGALRRVLSVLTLR
jgi:transposase